MKKYYLLKVLCLFAAIVLLANCKKDKVDDVSGIYTGTTQKWQTWNNPDTGSGSTDTTYADTIIVTMNNNTVFIGQNSFAVEKDHQYYRFEGTVSSYYAGFNTQTDSLVIQTYNYSGTDPGNFLQTDIEFKGKKQ
ncbi:hypothetical protein C7N43_19735 [Sphingobacteriales bacterium UPWRP_1]|nr:hypothetical protein B6N25_12970 [Sphingobacteriales bacterium TSM_CSS]PSJ75272.1 hypothetical protein C7N43_19735 [Sphingobacteriales bacterium UPWRP_1]